MSVTSSGAIKAGATAIVIADTSKFVADMMINETDIPNISIGTMATVTATPFLIPHYQLVVNTIAPVATVQSGVVNYPVTATILGVVPATRPSPAIWNNHYTFRPTGTSTTHLATGTTATDYHRQYNHDSLDFRKDRDIPYRHSGTNRHFNADQIAQFQQAQTARQQSNASAMSQLKQGMSLTVNLIEQQAQNVIVVPNQAIKTVSGKSYVQVKTSSGTPAQQQVTIGLKDVQNTQIISGLNVGDSNTHHQNNQSAANDNDNNRPRHSW